MSKIIMTFATLVALINAAHSEPRKTPDGKTYAEIVSQCAKEWRESETRKTTPRGQGQEAWNKFRADCVARAGWVSRNKPRA